MFTAKTKERHRVYVLYVPSDVPIRILEIFHVRLTRKINNAVHIYIRFRLHFVRVLGDVHKNLATPKVALRQETGFICICMFALSVRTNMTVRNVDVPNRTDSIEQKLF